MTIPDSSFHSWTKLLRHVCKDQPLILSPCGVHPPQSLHRNTPDIKYQRQAYSDESQIERTTLFFSFRNPEMFSNVLKIHSVKMEFMCSHQKPFSLGRSKMEFLNRYLNFSKSIHWTLNFMCSNQKPFSFRCSMMEFLYRFLNVLKIHSVMMEFYML